MRETSVGGDERTRQDLLARLTVALESRTVTFAVLRPSYLRLSRRVDSVSAGQREIRLAVEGAGGEQLPAVLEASASVDLRPVDDDPGATVESTSSLAVVDPEGGMRVSFTFHTAPYERQAIGLPVRVEVRGVPVPFLSAEDLVLHGLLSGEDPDVEVAEEVVLAERRGLDWDYLEAWARDLASRRGRGGLVAGLARLRR